MRFLWIFISAFLLLHSVAYATISVIDYISNRTDFQQLLLALQRTRLIPVLNRYPNITFFAPTDAAFLSHPDTIVTREQLLMHVLRYRRNISEFSDGMVVETGFVWGNRLGTGVGQRLKVHIDDNEKVYVGDKDVVVVESDGWAYNGVVHAVNAFLSLPETLDVILARIPDIQTVLDIWDRIGLTDRLRNTNGPPLTLFCPVNGFEKVQFSDVEWTYLTHDRGMVDLSLLGGFHVHTGDVIYVSDLISSGESNVTVPMRRGGNVTLTLDGNVSQPNVRMEESAITSSDILASNGVIHLLDTVSKPPSLLFNAYKLTIGLAAVELADAWTLYGLDSLVNDTQHALSLFIPPDRKSASKLGASEAYARFHIATHALDVRDGYSVAHSHLATQRTNSRSLPLRIVAQNGQIVSVQGIPLRHEPVSIGSTTLYPIASAIPEPISIVDFVKEDSTNLTRKFAVAMNIAGIGPELGDHAAMTYFIPSTYAFDASGLVLDYLMLPEAIEKLRLLVRQTAIPSHGIILSDELQFGDVRRLEALNGETLVVSRHPDMGLYVNASAPDGSMVTSRMVSTDHAVENGVVHILETTLLPSRVHLSVRDMLKGAGAITFMQAVDRVGLSGLLDQPTGAGYTILAPTDAAFANTNDTLLFEDTIRLRRLILGHILRGRILFDQPESIGSERATMLKNRMVIFKRIGTDDIVQVEGNSAIVVSRGIVTNGVVYKLDKVLEPTSGWGWFGWSTATLLSLGTVGGVAWIGRDKWRLYYGGYQALPQEEV